MNPTVLLLTALSPQEATGAISPRAQLSKDTSTESRCTAGEVSEAVVSGQSNGVRSTDI